MTTARPLGVTILAILFFLGAPSVLPLVAGIGLWTMRRWGYLLALISLGFSLVGSAFLAVLGAVLSNDSMMSIFAIYNPEVFYIPAAIGAIGSIVSLAYLGKRSALFT